MAYKNELSAFLKLFADRHQTYVRSRNSNTWRATSQWHYLSDEELFSSLRSDSSVRRAFGVVEKTNFLVIQIDGTKSPTAFQTTKNLQKQLKEIGLLPKTFYIDELEVWQIFVFFTESVSTNHAITLATTWLKNSWFDLDAEAVSLLPCGAPFQIPLQASFTWLNDELVRVVAASEISSENAISMFLQDLRTNAVSLEVFEHALLQTPSIHPVKNELVEPVFDFTPSHHSVQTVETNERELILDFLPTEVEIEPVEKSEEAILLLSVENSVQTATDDLKVELGQPVVEHEEIPEILLETEFEGLVHADQPVQADQTDQNYRSGNSQSELKISGLADSIPIESCEEQLLDQDEISQIKPIDENSLDQFHSNSASAVIQYDAEQQTEESIVGLETPILSGNPAVQSLLFIHEEASERPPPESKTASLNKAVARKSSSRDGPENKKKSVKASQKVDADWNSFEQLMLPFGTNTS